LRLPIRAYANIVSHNIYLDALRQQNRALPVAGVVSGSNIAAKNAALERLRMPGRYFAT
jgi:hypothetical protein